MTIKSLSGITVEEALKATAFHGSKQLRDRIDKLARQGLGEGAALLKVQALIETCRQLTDRRNRIDPRRDCERHARRR
jgi:hypothetical protein